MGSLDDERCGARRTRMERRLTFGSRTKALPPAARTVARVACVASILALFACGVVAGLARFGVAVPRHALSNASWHGVLVLPIFFGAVVSLERAVALGGGRHLFAPVAVALAGLMLLAGMPTGLAQAVLLAGATLALASASGLLLRHAELHLMVLALGVLSWWFGDLIWLLTDAPLLAVPGWLAFLVLTIAAERLELTRLRPTRPHARALFVTIVVTMLLSVSAAVPAPEPALRWFAASLLALAAWLTRYDIARVTVRQRGLTRFIAVCLLSGYGWLALSGALGLAGAWNVSHPWHDAALHALTLGFVISMALGHAPIVLPAVARIRVRYGPVFYLPLIALHATLAVRVAGALMNDFALRRAGAVGNAVALALFVAVMATSALAARNEARLVAHGR